MKTILNNYDDCIKFIKKLNGKNKIFINNAINTLDISSKVQLLKYVTGVKIHERENSEKSI